MKLGLERLKTAYREYVRGLNPPTRADCPPIDELTRFFCSQTSRRRKDRILDHVSRCGPCAEEFDMLIGVDRAARSFADSAGHLAPGPAQRFRPRKRTRGFWALGRLAAAGAGLAAVALGLWIALGRPTSPPDDDMALRSVGQDPAITLVGPAGSVDEQTKIAFRWRISGEYANASWVISLFDDSLILIWESAPSAAGQILLPPDIQASLGRGRKYYWGISLVSEESESDSDLAAFWIERSAKSSPNPVMK